MRNLIIVKFLSVQNFCQFYEQFTTGQVFLPSLNPLPDNSELILKLIIPLLNDSFLASGTAISRSDGIKNSSGFTVDFGENRETYVSEINHFLSNIEQYRHLLNLSAEEPDELAGIEMEILEDEIQILEDDFPEEDGTVIDKTDSFSLKDDDDEDLMNLRMENESDDTSFKVDLSHQPDFDFLEDDIADDFHLEENVSDVRQDVFPEGKQKDLLEFDLLPDDQTVSEGFVMDSESQDPASSSFANSEKTGVLFDELKLMVDQDEFEFEIEDEAPVTPKKMPEKKDLTPEERAKAEPVGQFFMNLTKAMLRSGYYAPGHPGTDSAKAGLYDEFTGVLGDQREIMITNHNSRDGIDLMITGILDEPISIRILVGPGVAELFVPKLSDYCERKKLLSFALKKDIQPDHFYQFIDIMSDPKVDDRKDEEAGRFLTNAFIERGITDISTVFVDDMVKLETDLPWRVEMAIHRLAKDLKVMPLFKGVSSEAIKKMKLQTVQDIIRPLKHPTYLNDFLVNCYIIAKYVTDMPAEEIEEIVVGAFSIQLLLPTSQYTFKELDSLKRLKKKHPDSEIIDRRFIGIKRILKLISRRVVIEEAPGAQKFLEHLYRNEILSFNELPADVQFIVNTMKMADDVRDNFSKYVIGINNLTNPSDALVYLKCFRRTVPVLIDRGAWQTLMAIANLIRAASAKKPLNTEKVHAALSAHKSDGVEILAESSLFRSIDMTDRPVVFIFKDVTDKIIDAYEHADSDTRKLIDQIIDKFGSFGVAVISQMLSESNDREVRKLSFEILINKGSQAKKWAIDTLKDISRPWYIHRNAMMIIEKLSGNKEDFSCIRPFLEHSNPKIREEALNIAVSLKPHDGESIVLNAIADGDPKVRWRAMRSLPAFAPVSESTMNELLNIISRPIPKDHAEAEKHISQTVHILSAINAMHYMPVSRRVEAEVIELIKSFIDDKKSLWKRVKKAVRSDLETPILKAAVPLLGKIGGPPSRSVLKKMDRFYPDLSEIIKKALHQIKS